MYAVSDRAATSGRLKTQVHNAAYRALVVLAAMLLGAACAGDAVPAAAITPTTQPAITPVPLFGAASTPSPADVPAPSVDAASTTSASGEPTPSVTAIPTRVAFVPTYWPTDGWRSSTPEEQGMDSALLAEMLGEIATGGFIHSVLVVRNGYIVLDAYFHPHTKGIKQDVADVTKSITSALVGIAIDQGAIDGVDQRVLDFFPDTADPDPKMEAMTIEHLLTMTTGLLWSRTVASDSLDQMMGSDNWVQFVLERPMPKEPGGGMNYNSGASHLLSAITQKATGMTAISFAEKHLFEPLGIADVSWASDPQDVNNGGSGVFITQHDMAKFGYLYLNRGTWDGRELVPTEWVDASTERHTTHPWWIPYGYQWWVYPAGPFAAMGQGGQVVFVVPEIDAVVVFTGGTGPPTTLWPSQVVTKDLLDNFIIPAALVTHPLPENLKGVKLLESLVRDAALAPDPRPVSPLPDTAGTVSGKTIGIITHPLRWDSLSLTFDDKEAAVSISFGDRQLEFSIGLDNVFRETETEDSQGRRQRIAARGSWSDETTFEFTSITLGGLHDYRTELTFEGRDVGGTISFGPGEDWSEPFRGFVQD